MPSLTGSGALVGGGPVSIDVTGALPSSLTWLFLGFDLGMTPLKDGILVPTLDLDPIGPFPLDGAGALNIPTTWPLGLPSGLITHFQFFVADPGGPKNAAATNALSTITP